MDHRSNAVPGNIINSQLVDGRCQGQLFLLLQLQQECLSVREHKWTVLNDIITIVVTVKASGVVGIMQ